MFTFNSCFLYLECISCYTWVCALIIDAGPRGKGQHNMCTHVHTKACANIENELFWGANVIVVQGKLWALLNIFQQYPSRPPTSSVVPSGSSGVARGEPRGHALQSRTIRIVGNSGPIAGCLINRVTKYRGYKDACVRLSFPILPFRKELFHHANRIKLGILHFCRWLQSKRWQSNENVVILNVHDD